MSDYVIPGWNDVVQDKHVAARDAFREWIFFGKPKAGPLFTSMKKTRASFKLALRFCKQHEEQFRADACALHLQHKDPIKFWKEISKISNSKARDVVSVSTSRSRDGLETYLQNVSVSSRSRENVTRVSSRSRLGLKTKSLGLVSVSDPKVSFTSQSSRFKLVTTHYNH